MEQQEEVDHTSSETYSAPSGEGNSGGSEGSEGPSSMTKRTPRILHESSFAASTFTSNGGPRRPPGFAASSLDYKAPSSSNGGTDENPVNPKPVKRKIQPQQEMDAQEQQKAQQQTAKTKKPTLPTRAKGNFGPPPHRIATLEDLEHLSEDELYRLFMEDPELYRSLLKSTGESKTGTQSTEGSEKHRSTLGSSTKRSLPPRVGEDPKVPYFQWLLVLVLVGVLLNQIRKTVMSENAKTKRGSTAYAAGATAKAKGGKQKKQKNKKDKFTTEEKDPARKTSGAPAKLVSKPTKPKAAAKAAVAPERPPSKQSKKESKPTTVAKIGTKNGDENPSLQSVAPPATETKIATTTRPATDNGQSNSGNVENYGDDGDWQTVAKPRGPKSDGNVSKSKASKGSTPAGGSSDPVNGVSERSREEGSSNASPTEAGLGVKDQGAEKARSNGHPSESSFQNENPGANSGKKKKKKKNSTSKGPTAANDEVTTTNMKSASTDDDAALAFQLQQQEEILANADSKTIASQEEAWEEVTSKKKRG
ncbi:hypothetical protein IV203_017166 [Nitzschia inconspicua]|uniref:Uncharacterized protein n=1 Tax=Nitzschia inconspicua TaxID=303405 RepID=A0A9K3PIZ2_9STRA|nr:hypothetical protein IV203_017166 [Nitzschia inconspicua]